MSMFVYGSARLCVWVPMCLCIFVFLCPCVCMSARLSVSLFLSFVVCNFSCLCVYMYTSFCVFIRRYDCLTLFLCLCVSVCVRLKVPMIACLCVCVFLRLCVAASVCPSCLYVCACVPPRQNAYGYVSLFVYVSWCPCFWASGLLCFCMTNYQCVCEALCLRVSANLFHNLFICVSICLSV